MKKDGVGFTERSQKRKVDYKGLDVFVVKILICRKWIHLKIKFIFVVTQIMSPFLICFMSMKHTHMLHYWKFVTQQGCCIPRFFFFSFMVTKYTFMQFRDHCITVNFIWSSTILNLNKNFNYSMQFGTLDFYKILGTLCQLIR